MEVHTAVDFHAPYGTPVYAPADGYAMSSYHNLFIQDRNKKIITYKGKEIKYGLGLFVRMYIPLTHRFLDLAHLSEIDNAIPFSETEFDEEEKIWKPTNEKIAINEIPSNPQWVSITKGQFLGRVGTSGLSWGYEDFTDKPQRKVTYDSK
ncbi:MAG: M23 family metallopeptidase, partial [Candidatus Daviesbacteria bacterium]|nr:M23 family metallopeptidase [Candidatus Daviesbacteria bacterium]